MEKSSSFEQLSDKNGYHTEDLCAMLPRLLSMLLWNSEKGKWSKSICISSQLLVFPHNIMTCSFKEIEESDVGQIHLWN